MQNRIISWCKISLFQWVSRKKKLREMCCSIFFSRTEKSNCCWLLWISNRKNDVWRVFFMFELKRDQYFIEWRIRISGSEEFMFLVFKNMKYISYDLKMKFIRRYYGMLCLLDLTKYVFKRTDIRFFVFTL